MQLTIWRKARSEQIGWKAFKATINGFYVLSFVLWRRPSATKQSLAVLACWTVCLSIMSARLQLKLLLLWIWAQFFIVWPIQDRHPRYRRALNPWWWLLWNVGFSKSLWN